MISTSEAYKTAVDSHRQEWKVRATIDYTDYNLDNSISAYVDEDNRVSDKAQLADGIEETTYKFFSGWAQFEWGQHFRSEESTSVEKGALSTNISNINKEFPTYKGRFVGSTFSYSKNFFRDYNDYPSFNVTFSART